MKKRAREALKRGQVWVVNFDPTVGSEIKKIRPAVILQNDIGNRYSPVTIVAALSSQFGPSLYPTEVPIEPPEGGLKERSVVLLNQIRSIDKKRLVSNMGTLSAEIMQKVDVALRISVGLAGL